jgi:predicted methyltransferase
MIGRRTILDTNRMATRTILTATTLLVWQALSPGSYAQHQPTDQSQHRRPADIKEYIESLERPDRDRDQQPARVIGALALKPGMAVADLGAGSGYFTRRFAAAVDETGIVYVIDIEQEFLTYTKESLERLHSPVSVEFILAQPDDPKLPARSVDLIFLCNTYHHLEDRSAYFSNVRSALKSAGRIVIIDFYHDERSGNVGFPRRHLVARDTTVAEMTKAGFKLVKEHNFLERQYFLEFVPVAP